MLMSYDNNVKITDNFLHPEIFDWVYNNINDAGDGDFTWTYLHSQDKSQDNKPMLAHMLYMSNSFFISPKFYTIAPILAKMYTHTVIKAKVNLTTQTTDPEMRLGGWHTDFDDCYAHFHEEWKNVVTTAVFYLSEDNDGYTELEDGTIVESKQNRLLEFPCHMKHRVMRHTKGPWERMVINLNVLRTDMLENQELRGICEYWGLDWSKVMGYAD